MKGNLGKKWLAVGAIWGLVLAITVWNIHLVNQVQSQRQQVETLQMDLRFIHSNQAGIQEVHRHQARLIHPVKSVGLGFLVVEDDLKRRSWEFGLQQMRVEADLDLRDTKKLPINVYMSGPVPSIVAWIAAVEEAYPYLVLDRMEIFRDHLSQVGRFQATFNYHFSLLESERAG